MRSASAGARSSSAAADRRSCTTTSARGEQLGAPHGQQPRVARSGADQVDGHAALSEPAPAGAGSERPPEPVDARRRPQRRGSCACVVPGRTRRTSRRASTRSQRQRAVVGEHGVRTGGQRAVAAELGQERPLGIDPTSAGRVLDRREQRSGRGRRPRGTRPPARAWATCGTNAVDVEHVGEVLGQPQPLERHRGDDDRVELGRLRQAGRHVAAQLGEGQVRPQVRELRTTTGRTGRHDRAGRQRRPGVAPTRASRGRPARAPRRAPDRRR